MPETSETSEFRLNFLCSLIPKSFDGKRSEFQEFLVNCKNAVELASDSQQKPLFVFIISRLTGSVRSQLQGKKYTNWEELKEILCTFYQDKKHYIQLMEELNTLKQGFSEPIMLYHERIDKIITRIIGSLSFKDRNEEKIKIDTINELGLSRFIHHSKPEISRFLRAQNFDNLSDALTKAIEEERAIGISNNEFKPKNPKYCNFCKRNGHSNRECFKNKNNGNSINFNQKSQNQNFQNNQYRANNNNSHANSNTNTNFQVKICNYCKNKGHLISECRKREYNNNRKASASNPPNSRDNQNPQVHLNLPASQVNAALVETDIQMA